MHLSTDKSRAMAPCGANGDVCMVKKKCPFFTRENVQIGKIPRCEKEFAASSFLKLIKLGQIALITNHPPHWYFSYRRRTEMSRGPRQDYRNSALPPKNYFGSVMGLSFSIPSLRRKYVQLIPCFLLLLFLLLFHYKFLKM